MDERIAKLPVWAQNHVGDLNSRIRALESDLRQAETALAAGPDDSEVFAETNDVTRPLGKAEAVAITFGSGVNSYTASLDRDGALSVEGVRDLVLEPVSSYEVTLRLKD